jgi:uncharacterized membrane protein
LFDVATAQIDKKSNLYISTICIFFKKNIQAIAASLRDTAPSVQQSRGVASVGGGGVVGGGTGGPGGAGGVKAADPAGDDDNFWCVPNLT